MSDTAVWLTEHVIPRVQIHQWVCSLPWELRVRAGYDRELCAFVVDTFVRELQRSYRWRAKREFGLSSVEDAFTGMVTVIQRFDSALRRMTRSQLDPREFGGGIESTRGDLDGIKLRAHAEIWTGSSCERTR